MNKSSSRYSPNRFIRAFKEGERAEINHDGYNNFPAGTQCTVTQQGILNKGRPTYHVTFDNGTYTTVFESELRPTKEKLH